MDHVSLDVADYTSSVRFYEQTLEALGLRRTHEVIREEACAAGFSPGRSGTPIFWISGPRGIQPRGPAAPAGSTHRSGVYGKSDVDSARHGPRVPDTTAKSSGAGAAPVAAVCKSADASADAPVAKVTVKVGGPAGQPITLKVEPIDSVERVSAQRAPSDSKEPDAFAHEPRAAAERQDSSERASGASQNRRASSGVSGTSGGDAFMTAESHRLDSETIPELESVVEHVDEQTQTQDLKAADPPAFAPPQYRYSYKLSASPADDPMPPGADEALPAAQDTSDTATCAADAFTGGAPVLAAPSVQHGAAELMGAGARPGGGGARRIHFAFTAPSAQAVKVWYDRALALGARDNGKPGPRPHYHPGYFAAYVIDPDGWHLEAVTHSYRAPRPAEAWWCSWNPFRR